MKPKFIIPALAVIGLLSSCSKKDDPVTGQQGDVTMKFENYVGTKTLNIGTPLTYKYLNANGDSFNVSTYKYYVSHIRLVGSNGAEYAEPESYHFMNAADPSSLSFTMTAIPAGTYTAVKVLLGVDSLRNVSGAQTGALDPLHGMFWTWSSGYIMAKIEGTSSASSDANKSISFHLGGFSGQYSVLNEVTLPLPQDLVISNGATSTMTLKSDLLKWFEAPTLIKFSELSQVGAAGEDAYKLAKNYSHSLSVTAVQN